MLVYVNLINVKRTKKILLSIRVFTLRPNLFSQVKAILIHWVSNESHGKSERLEVNTEDFGIV